MVQYFSVLLILCISGVSLGTTTSPLQQNTAKLKDLCEVTRENFFTFQKKVHNNVAWEPPATVLIATIQIHEQVFAQLFGAIFNLHKSISYHINRKETHITQLTYFNCRPLSLLQRLGIQRKVFR